MPTFHTFARRTSFALLTVALLGAPGALGGFVEPPDTLSVQVKAMSATGLTFTECQERVQQMTGILGQTGYHSMRPYARGDAMIASWYGQQRDSTFLAFFGVQAAGNDFSVVEVPGLVRSNEFFGIQ